MDPQVQSQNQYQGGQSEFDPGAYDRYFGGGRVKVFVFAFLKGSEKFLATIDDRIQGLKTAVASGDPVQVAHAGHSLKGSFRTLGANHLADLAEVLEKEFQQMSNDEIAHKMQDITDRLVVYKRELIQFSEHIKPAVDVTA